MHRPLLLLAGVALLLGAKCPPGRKTAAKAAVTPAVIATSAIPDSADQVIFGMRVLLSEKGVVTALLLSDTAYSFNDGGRLELQRVNVTFYTKQGIEDGTLVSRAGTYNSVLRRLEARGDVIVNRKDGRRLTTPQLVYDQMREQIFSDSTFTLTEPSKQVSGIGFESDPRLTVFKCLRACKGVAPVQIPAK